MEVTRRSFLSTVVGGACAALAPAGRAESALPPRENTLRTISYNVYGCKGWPERKGNRARLAASQPQIPEQMAELLHGYAPDIVTLSEAPDEEAVGRMAAVLEMKAVCFASPEGFPGAVLTRLPVREQADCPQAGDGVRPEGLFTRHFGRVLTEWQGRELVVYSAHLHPIRSAIRLREIEAALASMQMDMASGRLLLLQGDLNHVPERKEYEAWKAAGLVDAFERRGCGPKETVPSSTPKARIDYVWAHGGLAETLAECRVLHEPPFLLNANDPSAFALSDHLPVMADFGEVRWEGERH